MFYPGSRDNEQGKREHASVCVLYVHIYTVCMTWIYYYYTKILMRAITGHTEM